MLDRLFFELVEDLDNVASENVGADSLSKMAEKFGLTHASYLGVNIPLAKQDVYILTTYTNEWVHQYVSKDYVKIDPVIQLGLRGIMPLDWKDLRDKNETTRNFFGESREFGLGRQGLTIPMRGAHGEIAMFSLNVDIPDRRWESEKRKLIRDFSVLAYHFHNRVLEQYGVHDEDVKLSSKEIEVLKWSAQGKANQDIADILRISERTVRFHLECARAKLNTINTTQAVARAIRLGLI
ncbi:helix-turn-helix transcriptional regulator [Hyphomicrobium sp. DMF-1]|jgi:DNA-binding CsgD family transcriptional regulator|uniref:helix-turn-helix transcriptional regulator n=1 Tax=Hyphomicrobium sp. DMF-1 TaxID=3019544 RepID=UPI0022EBD57F|nr:LuxR family transcriptional regulator [Hyphomicrobium sp. DMF-1]WBT39175.1 LuxR family transcriptional regulator [Hyphomicrobium sp. DMF-1]